MFEVLDAMDSYGDSPAFFLDTETGAVALWLDPLETGGVDSDLEFDPNDPRYLRIPQRKSHDAHAAMERFVDGLEDEDLQTELRQALAGKGAFQRFRGALAGAPDAQAAWEQAKRESLLAEARAWLAGLGIDPVFDLPPLPVPQPLGRPAAGPGEARVGLFDLLLLGAPEVDGDLVRRTFVAADAERARKTFTRLARELCEHHGISWRRRFIEDRDHYEVDRCSLRITGRRVVLEVEVARAIWELFAAAPAAPASR